MAIPVDVSGVKTVAGTVRVPASWGASAAPAPPASAPAGAPATAGGPATNTFGGSNVAGMVADFLGGYGSLLDSREAIAAQMAIAKMQDAYNRDRLKFDTDQAARQYALSVGAQEYSRQMATGWVQQNPYVTTGNMSLQAPQTWQPTMDWQQMAGWAYDQAGNKTPTLGREQWYATLTGPTNMWAYQNAMRGQPTSPNLPWATALQGGTSLPAFQASNSLPGYWEGEANVPNIAPHQVNLATWNKLQPSEREAALSAAERQGWLREDYLNQLYAAAPTGTAGNTSWWQV